MSESKKELCQERHDHIEGFISATARANVYAPDMCPACAYEMGYRRGYDAAFGIFEERIENLIFNWNLAPTSKSENEKEKSSGQKTIRTYRNNSRRGSVSIGKSGRLQSA